jgi:hypothetical protein
MNNDPPLIIAAGACGSDKESLFPPAFFPQKLCDFLLV